MEKLCSICNKIPTRHPSGTCAVCRMDNGMDHEDRSYKKQKTAEDVRSKPLPKKEKCMATHHPNCSVEGCAKFAVKEGMCIRHYKESKGLPFGRQKKREGAKCSIEGCDGVVKSKGICNKHYLQELKEKGRLGRGKKIKRGSRKDPCAATAGPAPDFEKMQKEKHRFSPGKDIVTRLRERKFDLEMELNNINLALEVIESLGEKTK